jgi:glycosyltransferase involved in cell wall biosynthesis
VATLPSPVWFCAQLGAREHYAIPRALHRTKRLAALCTDFWANPVVRKIARGGLQPLAERFHSGLADAEIVSWNFRSLYWEAGLRLRPRGEDTADKYLDFIEVGRKFASAVRENMRRNTHRLSNAVFFAYDTAALEALEFLRECQVKCVVDQMDPSRVEAALVGEEEKIWPGWAMRPIHVPEEYFQRREREWSLADRIVVNSEFSRQALIRQGVPTEKLAVIPLCYEAGPREEANHREMFPCPLKILFLGQVILRKGIQYLMETAKLLRDEPVRIDVVGPIGITADAVKSAPPNLAFHGRVSRDQAAGWYRQSDLFVLPTLSDGFALTQLEAMAHGLPVIATPNCGDVVTNGVDGFVVPPRDPGALAKAVMHYIENHGLLPTHRAAARHKAGQFTLSRLGDDLAALGT